MKKEPPAPSPLNVAYRNGGLLVDRSVGRDCCTVMNELSRRPDMLENALRAMGITEDGDEPKDRPA